MPPGRGPPLKGDRGGGEGKGWGREKAGADKGRSAPDLRRRPGRDGSEAWRSAGVLVKGWQDGRCQAPGGGPALPLRRRGDHIAGSRRASPARCPSMPLLFRRLVLRNISGDGPQERGAEDKSVRLGQEQGPILRDGEAFCLRQDQKLPDSRPEERSGYQKI